jgi:hypothetical protein
MSRQELVEATLTKFAKRVIQQARTNLTKKKKNFDKTLYNSLTYKLNVSKNSFYLNFYMEEYGAYQDEGVKGAGGTRKTTSSFNRRNNKGKIWKQKAPNSRFKFKEGKKPSVKHFKKWAQAKGLSPYAVRESVFRQGISPSKFFTTPFRLQFQKLPQELIDAFGLGPDDFQMFATNPKNK